MRIRLMKKDDIEQVAKLLVESSEKESKERRWNIEYANQYIIMISRINKDLCFVATEGEKVIGVALSIMQPEFNRNILKSKVLLVHPKFRQKKVGSKLIRKICIKALNKYGIKEIETGIYTLTNFPISWYDNIGFRQIKDYEVTRAQIEKVLIVV